MRNEINQMRGKNKSPSKQPKSDNDSTILVNELEASSNEKNIEIVSNSKTTKMNQRSLSPAKYKNSGTSSGNKYVHYEYRHPGTFVILIFHYKN